MKKFLNIYFVGVVLFGIGLITLMVSSNHNLVGALLCTSGIALPLLWDICVTIISAFKSKK